MHRSHVTLIAALAFALAACGDGARSGESEPPPRAPSTAGGSAPERSGGDSDDAALSRLSADGNRLLDGGKVAFEERLADLRGTPVVVNQWASWCPPCRAEFPIFERLAQEYAGRVAFLGVDMQDDRDAAEAFMAELPTPYPHYFDEDASISRLFGGGRVSPTTGFYDEHGKVVFSHLGAYADDAQLDAEIRRYALR